MVFDVHRAIGPLCTLVSAHWTPHAAVGDEVLEAQPCPPRAPALPGEALSARHCVGIDEPIRQARNGVLADDPNS